MAIRPKLAKSVIFSKHKNQQKVEYSPGKHRVKQVLNYKLVHQFKKAKKDGCNPGERSVLFVEKCKTIYQICKLFVHSLFVHKSGIDWIKDKPKLQLENLIGTFCIF